ncbi:MAG: hypothetical protein ACPG20_05055, partial [Pontimonas sp.]
SFHNSTRSFSFIFLPIPCHDLAITPTLVVDIVIWTKQPDSHPAIADDLKGRAYDSAESWHRSYCPDSSQVSQRKNLLEPGVVYMLFNVSAKSNLVA